MGPSALTPNSVSLTIVSCRYPLTTSCGPSRSPRARIATTCTAIRRRRMQLTETRSDGCPRVSSTATVEIPWWTSRRSWRGFWRRVACAWRNGSWRTGTMLWRSLMKLRLSLWPKILRTSSSLLLLNLLFDSFTVSSSDLFF